MQGSQSPLFSPPIRDCSEQPQRVVVKDTEDRAEGSV